MSVIRIVAALLLAIALLAAAFAGFWLVSLRYAEAALVKQLEDRLGAKISYKAPQWQPDFGQVRVWLPDVTMTMTPPGTRAEVTVTMPLLELRSSFFDQARRLVVRLPQRAQLVWHDAARNDVYELLTEGTEFTFLQENGKGSVLVRSPALRVGLMAGGEARPLLLLTDGYFGWSPGQTGGYQVDLGAKSVSGVAGRAEDVLLKATLNRMPVLGARTVQVLVERSPAARRLWLQGLAEWMRAGGALTLHHAVLRNGTEELAAFGELEADRDGIPLGKVSLTASRGADLVGWLQASGLLLPGDMEEMFRRQQIFSLMTESAGMARASLVLHQGVAIMNTQRVGPVNKLGAMVARW